jgi:hypothetical protein
MANDAMRCAAENANDRFSTIEDGKKASADGIKATGVGFK